MKTLRENGYSMPKIVAYNFGTGWIHHAAVWLLAYHAIGYRVPEKWDRSLWRVPATVLFNLVLSELLFTPIHAALHEVQAIANVHLFHHCAKWPGMMQNTCFHPLDFFVELGAAVATIIFTHHYVNKCALSTLVSSSVVYVWYNSDHDESRNSHHVMHHKAVNGLYTVYMPYDFGVKRELIRGVMQENRQKSKQAIMQN